MARMLPSQVSPDVKSRAEKRLFSLLQEDPDTRDWICLHSLGLSRHVSQRYGEIDFVVMVPGAGIFVLEVKGGVVRCVEGAWEFQNRYGNVTRREKSPFLQARDNMFTLRNVIAEHFGKDHRLSNLVYGHGVLFPDIEWDHEDTEHESWQIYDRTFRLPVSAWVRQLASHTTGSFPYHPRPSAGDMKELTAFLRPDFEYVVRPLHRMQTGEEDMLRLTTEQYEKLDLLELNERAVIDGAAGTGKTLLAMERARRLSRDGKRVLLLCFNRPLGNWLGRLMNGTGVAAGSFHRFLEREIIRKSRACDEFERQRDALKQHTDTKERRKREDEFYKLVYPCSALDALIEDVIDPFDVLFVDEGQDLIRPEYLDVFDALLRGGLAGGRWAFFCDFERQALYADDLLQVPGGDTDPARAMLGLLQDRGHLARGHLHVNCRNTQPIGQETSLLSGFDAPPFRFSGIEGIPVDYSFYGNPKKQRHLIEDLLHRLNNTGVSAGQVTILSPRTLKNSCLAQPLENAPWPIMELQDEGAESVPGEAVVFSTVHSFKGLENLVVILTDVEHLEGEYYRRLLYVAMSRARQRLFVHLAESAKMEYQAALRRKMEKELGRS